METKISLSGQDARWMGEALREARRAAAKGEVPVGAVIVREGRVVARGGNKPIRSGDPTAHAEIVAIRAAARKTGNYRLTGCEIYVTVEPCAMCLGAILQARLARLVYGAADPKAGAVKSIIRFPIRKTNHKLDVRGGVGEEESAAVLRDFFRARRKNGPARKPEPV